MNFGYCNFRMFPEYCAYSILKTKIFTALCQARHINPSLVLAQPRKTRPYITERLLMGRKESNQTNKQTNKQTQVLLYFEDVTNGRSSIIRLHIQSEYNNNNNTYKFFVGKKKYFVYVPG